MLRYTYTSGSLYCCTSGHVTLSKITLSHHGVGVDIITNTAQQPDNRTDLPTFNPGRDTIAFLPTIKTFRSCLAHLL